MEQKYSFLNDELALIEIRKHKWIESEKHNAEIGFATAAVDWIKKYGYAWKKSRLGLTDAANVLSEKRQHRRFPSQLPVEIKLDNTHISAKTDDISLVGLSCTIPAPLPSNAPADVTIRFIKTKGEQKIKFQFASRVLRVSKTQRSASGYTVFLSFTEEVRDYIRANAESLCK